ncbi:unnamed protein product, partial [Prorocentrum cordatum]
VLKGINERKPALTCHATLGLKLTRAQQKLATLESEVAEHRAAVAAQEALSATREKAAAAKVETDACKLEPQSTMQPALLEFSPEALAEAPIEVQQLAQSEAFTKYKELLAQQEIDVDLEEQDILRLLATAWRERASQFLEGIQADFDEAVAAGDKASRSLGMNGPRKHFRDRPV